MSNEEMLAHYDAGIVTRSELLCYLALNLSLQNWDGDSRATGAPRLARRV